MVVPTGTKDTRINQREVRTRLKNAVRQRHEGMDKLACRAWTLVEERVLGRKQQRAVRGVRKLTSRIKFCGVLEDCVLV